jgi:uncharacterized Zn ribbon protein
MKHTLKCPSCKKEFSVEELNSIKCPSCKKEGYWYEHETDKYKEKSWFYASWEEPKNEPKRKTS